MGFKFVHAADIHLDSPLRGLERHDDAPSRFIRSATRRAFENLITLCLEEGAAFLVLAGDLYDGQWRDYNTVLYFIRQLSRLREAGIRVFIVLGNHDAENTMNRALKLPDHVKVFSSTRPETVELRDLGVALHGQSYKQPETTEDLSTGYPKPRSGLFNIGILHTNADGEVSEHKPYAPCSVRSLVDKGYQYWALGHVHRRTEVALDPLIIFPGNLQGRHIRETGAKGATLVTVDDDLKAHAEHRDLDVMRWHVCRVAVDDVQTPESAVDRVEEQLTALQRKHRERPLAVRVLVSGRCHAHPGIVARSEHWEHEVRGRAAGLDGVWVEKVVLETQTPIDLAALRGGHGALPTLLRCLDQFREDRGLLRELSESLSPARRALGALEDEPVYFEDDAELLAILGRVEQMLVPMLLEGGHSR